MTIVSPPPTPGDQVGPYVLHELLGVGGMATVYRAVDDTGGVCAVKILHPGKAQTDEVKRFEREFLALRDLRHPSVVQVYEAGMAGDYPWIAMEYVDGSDLGSLVDRWTANPPADQFAQAERILRGLCEGLAMIHDEGLIHRDLKPSNVLVASSGEAKITDFGVVKASGAFTTQLTVAGKLVGTVAFMSPEQITGDPVTPASDLYSLGAVLYVLLALRRPIEADNIAGYLARHITETPRPPSEYDSNVPPHLERICMQMLKKEANQRPVSARQVLAKLDGDCDSPSKVLHGRDREIEWFRDCLSEVERGAGGLAIVVGELGSGRTALLEAFVEQAQSRELAVAAASGARTELVGQLARQLPARAAGSASWLGLGTAATLQPTLIVIDDMDHMGTEMISGLTNMLRQRVAIEGMPIFVVGSVESTTGRAQGLCTGADTGLTTDQLVLSGLERSAIISLVRDQGVGGAVAAALGRRLTGELAGMPGAVLEQISALVQTGWLVPTPDGGLRSGCTMDALRNDPLPLPDRIRRKEAARIESLGEDARHLFDVLVVLDMEATLELVGEIAALDPTILGRALHELSQAQLIRERSEGIHDIVSLRGDRNRDVAYQLISKSKRTVLHQSVAASLRRRSRRRSGTFAEVIASHLLSGGQVGEAYPMLLVAAETTLRAGKSKQASKLLEKAERARQVAESNMEEKVRIRCQRRLYTLWGSVYHRMSQPRKALEAWRQALAVAREEGSAESIARAQAGMGLSRVAIGEVVAASSGLEQALGQLPQGDPMWAEAAEALAGARLSRGDVDGARRLWGELLDLGKEMGEGSVHARALAGLSLISLVKGRYGEGQDGLENAIFRMRDQANQNLLPDAMLWLAEFLYAQGYLEKAREHALEADGVARDIPRLRLCTAALGLASQALFDLGVPHDARTLAQDSATMARAQGPIETIGEVESILPAARVLVGLGAFEEAQKLLPNMPPSNTREMVGISDPMGGLLAIKSRVVLKRNPTVAVALARQVADRPAAILPWAGTRHLLDAAFTLVSAKDERAEEVVRKIIERVEGGRFRLLKMEAGLFAEFLGIEPAAAAEAHRILEALDHELGSPEGFRSRWLDSISG
jgi:tetratricopeptide (TPR) repeat protein